jgi:hypothetical protein
MRDGEAGIACHRLQGADLVGDHQFEIFRVHVDPAAAEAPEVVETGMNAHAHALLFRQQYEPMHGVGIAGMKAAGDAGRLDDAHQLGVVADVVGAEAFGDICIQVDLQGHDASFSGGWVVHLGWPRQRPRDPA